MNCKKLHRNCIGFSLIEVLTVVAITAMLMTMAIPAISGFTSPAGRKGAVTIVMNTLEQARVSAIETGRETVVLFWKKNGVAGFPPDEEDAVMVLRKNEAAAWESISRWVKLPKGVLFQSENTGSLILTAEADQTMLDAVPHNSADPKTKPAPDQSGSVQFTTSGSIVIPSGSSDGLYIAFTEGQRDAGTGDMTVDKQKSGGQEVISLARYTGRSTMDIVDLQ
jgi:prepilin-type N-terminal cleavage/methylation domain-containing protein